MKTEVDHRGQTLFSPDPISLFGCYPRLLVEGRELRSLTLPRCSYRLDAGFPDGRRILRGVLGELHHSTGRVLPDASVHLHDLLTTGDRVPDGRRSRRHLTRDGGSHIADLSGDGGKGASCRPEVVASDLRVYLIQELILPVYGRL